MLDPGEEPRPPRIPLVAIYPKEGTLFSDNPFFVLDAPWVTDERDRGAKLFTDFVQQPDNQQQVLQYNFRPGNPTVAIGAPITADNGVDPDQPQTLLQVPAARRCWSTCSTGGASSARAPGCCWCSTSPAR